MVACGGISFPWSQSRTRMTSTTASQSGNNIIPTTLFNPFSLSSDTARLPPAPRKLRARAISPHVIKLKWRDPGKNKGRATRFYSVRYSAVGHEQDGKFLQSHDSRARVSKLHPNTTYRFAVRAVAGKRGSPWSKAVVAVTAVVGQCVCVCVCVCVGGGSLTLSLCVVAGV